MEKPVFIRGGMQTSWKLIRPEFHIFKEPLLPFPVPKSAMAPPSHREIRAGEAGRCESSRLPLNPAARRNKSSASSQDQ